MSAKSSLRVSSAGRPSFAAASRMCSSHVFSTSTSLSPSPKRPLPRTSLARCKRSSSRPRLHRYGPKSRGEYPHVNPRRNDDASPPLNRIHCLRYSSTLHRHQAAHTIGECARRLSVDGRVRGRTQGTCALRYQEQVPRRRKPRGSSNCIRARVEGFLT